MTVVARPRTENTAPVMFFRCPCHDRLVATDGEGRLLGTCSGCMADSARAFLKLRQFPRRMLVFA